MFTRMLVPLDGSPASNVALPRGEARNVDGVPAGIVEAAEVLETDLIVMSTHGRTELARTMLGSVAESVVRTASCPVLLARQSEPHSIVAADPSEAAGIQS